MRISDFRVIFLIKEKSDNLKLYTFIIKADSRGDIYKKQKFSILVKNI